MADTLPLFEGLPPPPEPAPRAKRGSPRVHPLFPGATSTQRATAWAGLHPLGHPMPEVIRPDVACGNCLWVERHGTRSKSWYKCGQAPRRGAKATDTRVRWPGCILWALDDEVRTIHVMNTGGSNG